MTARPDDSERDENARSSDAAEKAGGLSQTRIDARGSQGVQINEQDGNFQLNIFAHRADEAISTATPDEFRADIIALLENLNNAACRLHLPAYLPAGTDITRMTRTVRFVGRVRRSPDIDENGAAFRWQGGAAERSNSERIYALPAERDDREGEPPQPWEQVAVAHEWLVVLADPGMGKSWLLRNETHRHARTASASLRESTVGVSDVIVPVLIRADMLAASEGQTLANAACNHLVAEGLLADRSRVPLEERINDGGAVLLIDALDEVPRDSPIPGVQAPRKRLEDLLRHWADHCTGIARCVLTTRLAGYSGPPVSEAREVELLPFTAGDAESAIQAWGLQETVVNRVMGLLRDPGLAGMARVPLLLALICSLAANFPNQQPLPKTRVGIYEAVVWQFLSGAHRSADRGASTSVTSQIERQMLLRVLTKVAITFASTDRGWIDQMPYAELVTAIGDAEGTAGGLKGSATTILTQLSDQAGILVPAGNPAVREQAYLFLHRTIAEYLVACHLGDILPASRISLIEEHQWFDPDWSEVIPMLGGLLSRLRLSEAQTLVTHFLSQRPDPLHRAFHMALRTLGESPDPDRLLTKLQAHDVSKRIQNLLNLDVTRTGLLRALAAAPAWPRAVIDPMLSSLQQGKLVVRRAVINALAVREDPGVTEAKLALLKDQHRELRRAAARGVAWRKNAEVTEALLELLEDEDRAVRLAAVEALAGREGPDVTDALLARFADEYRAVRNVAATALARREGPGVTEALVHRLDDSNKYVRRLSGRALAGRDTSAVTEALLSHRTDNDWVTRRTIARALSSREDPRVTDVLLSLLKDSNKDVRRAATEALAGRDAPAVTEALLTLLGDEFRDVRLAAAEVLAVSEAADVTKALLACLRDRSRDVRRSAVRALAGRQCGELTKMLLEHLEDHDEAVRRTLVEVLAERETAEVTDALLARLADEHRIVRRAAVEALAQRDGANVTEALVARLTDEHRAVRLAAVKALAGRNGPTVSDELFARLNDVDWATRSAAVRAIEALPGEEITTALIALLGDKQGDVRLVAIDALARRGGQRVTKALLALLVDQQRGVRVAAVEALAGREGSVVTEALLALLGQEDREVRRATIQALGRRNDPAVTQGLIARLHVRSWTVRRAAVDTLAVREGPVVTLALLGRLTDSNQYVRQAAVEALAWRDDPVILARVCRHSFWVLPSSRRKNRFEMADRIADRLYLMLAPGKIRQVRHHLGQLTRNVSRRWI